MKFLLVACFAIFAVSSGSIPAVSQWTLQELSEAVQDPNTDPMVLPYLEQALDDMMLAMWHGVDQSVATVVLPAAVVEAIATPVVEPEATKPVSQSSPLVQIILNINANGASNVLPEAVATPIIPEAVATIPESNDVVQVVDTVVIDSVGVASPVIIQPVAVAELPEVVAVAELPAVPESMPIAVATPINPIDILAPVPVVGAGGGIHV